ncbi:MAG: hypothetical protein PHH82_04065 [Candidatus ainarchaeum sp.]|nr:hypothetical protein [Candidatus ainarchaeum sp.]
MDAYTHGRFQPFHKGHLKFVLYLLGKYDILYIGISNPLRKIPAGFEGFSEKLKESLEHARDPRSNPFNYFEREQIILDSLREEGVDLSRVKILPHFAIYEDSNWFELMPPKESTVIAIPAKDEHHFEKIRGYEKVGYKVEIIPQMSKDISGSRVRESIYAGTEEWKEIVPKGAIPLIEKWIENGKSP